MSDKTAKFERALVSAHKDAKKASRKKSKKPASEKQLLVRERLAEASRAVGKFTGDDAKKKRAAAIKAYFVERGWTKSSSKPTAQTKAPIVVVTPAED